MRTIPSPNQPQSISSQQPKSPHTRKPPFRVAFSPLTGFDKPLQVSIKAIVGLDECFTWHRAIFAGSFPPTIVAAAAFHNRVRDGSVWVHSAMDTRIVLFPELNIHPQGNPENCIGSDFSSQCAFTQPGLVSQWSVIKHLTPSVQESSVGQALGLLVLLRFTCYQAST